MEHAPEYHSSITVVDNNMTMTPEKRSHEALETSGKSIVSDKAPYWLVQAANGLSSLAAVAAIASPAPSLSHKATKQSQQAPAPQDTTQTEETEEEGVTVDKEPPRKKQRRHDEKWHHRYQQLKEYYDENGHCNVPQKYEQNPHLGRWVDKQRHQFKVHALKLDRLELLNAIGFTWGNTKSLSPETHNSKPRSASLASTPSCTPLSSVCSSSASSSASTASMSSEEDPSMDEESTPSPPAVQVIRKTTEDSDNNNDKPEDCPKIEEQSQASTSSSSSSRRYPAPKHNAKWMQRYQALKEYKLKEGNCLVPQKDDQYKGLGSWVMNQRKQHKLMRQGKPNSMTPDRLQLLEELDFEFDPHGSLWSTRYNELVTYKDTFGDCMVPYKNDENPALGLWVDKQRRQYRSHKKGNQSFMTQERIEKLEAIGFCWEPLDAIPARSAARSLNDHLKQHTDSATTTTTTAAAASNTKTTTQNHQASPQAPDPAITERLQQLQSNQTTPESASTASKESPPPSSTDSSDVESPPMEASSGSVPGAAIFQMDWMEGFSKLEKFYKETGSCKITAFRSMEKDLVDWLKVQQCQYNFLKRGIPSQLTPERLHLLKTLNFDFENWTDSQDWNVMYQELLKYNEKHGVSEVPMNTPLGNWIDEQRHAYRKRRLGKFTGLSEERVGKLYLKMNWQPQNHIDWAIKFEALQKLYKFKQHTKVSKEENPELFVWIDTQRKQWKLLRQNDPACLLTLDQYRQLRTLNFEFEPNPEWKKRMDELKAYRKRTGDRSLVNHPQLRMWLEEQHTEYKLWSEKKPCRLSEREIRTLKEEGLAEEFAKKPVAPAPPAPSAYQAPTWAPPPHAHHWGSHMPPAWPPQQGWGHYHGHHHHHQPVHPPPAQHPSAASHHGHAWGHHHPMPPPYY